MKKIFFILAFLVFTAFVFTTYIQKPVYAGGCMAYHPYVGCYDEYNEATGRTRTVCPSDSDYNSSTANACCIVNSNFTETCASETSCFLPGTLVSTQTGSKKIEDIKVGDKVTSFENGKIKESKVSQIYKRERDFYLKLKAEGEYSVKASAEHPFYVGNNQYKQISELKKTILFMF